MPSAIAVRYRSRTTDMDVTALRPACSACLPGLLAQAERMYRDVRTEPLERSADCIGCGAHLTAPRRPPLSSFEMLSADVAVVRV